MPGHDTFPGKKKRIYIETLKALNSQTPILAAIGLRALIELICLEQKTRATNLVKRIDELAEFRLLSAKQVEFLHNHRFMDNEAVHEIIAPKPEHLVAANDIAETLLKTIYLLPWVAEQKKPRRPDNASVRTVIRCAAHYQSRRAFSVNDNQHTICGKRTAFRTLFHLS